MPRWPDGYVAMTKEERYAKYYQANKERLKARQQERYAHNKEAILAADTIRRYGVDRAALLAEQGGVCAVCGQIPQATPAVDHDHACCPGQGSCGECVRGVLCQPCNKGLGNFADDPDRLLAAAAYLLARVDVLGGISCP